jgi:hypothetical protein
VPSFIIENLRSSAEMRNPARDLIMGAALLNTLSQLPAVGLDAHGHIERRLVAQSDQLIALVSALSVYVLTNAPLVAYAYSWLIGETCRHAMLLQACRRLFELRTLKLLTGHLSAILLSVPPAWVASLSNEASSLPAKLLIVLSSAPVALLTLACTRTWPVRRSVRRLGFPSGRGKLARLCRTVAG